MSNKSNEGEIEMLNIEKLNSLIYDEKVREKILNDNMEQLDIFVKTQTFVEDELLIKLNDIKTLSPEEGRINQAIFILLSQAIKSDKTAICLCIDGYFGNAVIILRNILETIFNIKFILEKQSEKLKRANSYLDNSTNNNWSNESLRNKAYKSLDSFLYDNVYRIFCNYVHSNYIGTGQNLSEGSSFSISINPSDKKISNTLNFINTIYYYLIQFIANVYEIDDTPLDHMGKPEAFLQLLNSYSQEQNTYEFFDSLFREQGLTEEEILDFRDEFKRYRLNNSKNKSKNKS